MRRQYNKNGPKASSAFWNEEYGAEKKGGGHLALSDDPSEDLVKFTRWMEREFGRKFLNPLASVTDLGCGNGRNLIYLADEFGMQGEGFDISQEAIARAKSRTSQNKDLRIQYKVYSMASMDPLPVADRSQTLVLDMMSSHFLNGKEREHLRSEIARILKPDGWLFYKTFLLDADAHAERLLREHPGGEAGTYIHPHIGVAEHVSTEKEIVDAMKEHFFIHKMTRSHRHLGGGPEERARQRNAAKGSRGHRGEAIRKRRSISVYAQKI